MPDTWVPLTQMADPSKLSEWVFNWVHGRDERLRRAVFEAGSRLREYKIPMYTVVVEEQDSALLGEIFHRVNNSGKQLKWTVIHDALYGTRAEADRPSTLAGLADALAELGVDLDAEALTRFAKGCGLTVASVQRLFEETFARLASAWRLVSCSSDWSMPATHVEALRGH